MIDVDDSQISKPDLFDSADWVAVKRLMKLPPAK